MINLKFDVNLTPGYWLWFSDQFGPNFIESNKKKCGALKHVWKSAPECFVIIFLNFNVKMRSSKNPSIVEWILKEFFENPSNVKKV